MAIQCGVLRLADAESVLDCFAVLAMTGRGGRNVAEVSGGVVACDTNWLTDSAQRKMAVIIRGPQTSPTWLDYFAVSIISGGCRGFPRAYYIRFSNASRP